MNSFDDVIREKAKSESINIPAGFIERNDKLMDDLVGSSKKKGKHMGYHTLKYKAAVIVLAILCLGGTTAAANELLGGDFFAKFFSDKVGDDTSNNSKYMDTEQIKDMESSTVGTVVDTDEISIDVMGVIVSGNTADVMIKVTAKKLDSVYYDNGLPMLSNYKLSGETMNSIYDDSDEASIGYYYSNEDKSLAENQFKVLYTFIGKDKFNGKEYDLHYKGLGYYDKDLKFVTIYDTDWHFNITFDAKSDHSKELFIDQAFHLSDINFKFEKVNITPLACSLKFTAATGGDSNHTFSEFGNDASNITVNLKDGTELNNKDFTYISSRIEDEYGINLTFTAPINVDDVKSITVFGIEYSME